MLYIRAEKLYTVSHGVIPDGVVAVEGHRILRVGPATEIAAPEGARVLTAAVATPGLIDAHTHLGVSEQGLGFEGADYNETVDPATPHMRAIDGINPHEEGFADAVAAGITAAWVTPGSANVIGGQGATLRTHGRTVDQMILQPFSALKAALGENPKRVYNAKNKITTRMGNAAAFREWFYKAKAYLEKQERARTAGTEPPEYDLRLEPIAAVLRGEVPVRIHAHRHDDIMTAVRLCTEFGLRFTIEHCTEGHKVVDELRTAPGLVGVVVGPTMSAKSKVELRDKSWETAGVLAAAGIRTAITTDHPVIPIQYLPLAAAYAVKAGMDPDLALRSITLSAAEIAGVGDRLGSLEPGKEADIALFDGDPFAVSTRTVATVIAGQVVYQGE